MLSKKSEQFLDNLRTYLLATGKNEKEAVEIVEELRTHLMEAEAEGKSIEKIIGQSPKEYMESISKELEFDGKQALLSVFMIILGALSLFILPDIIRGGITFSLFKLLGALGIFLVAIVFIIWSVRKISRDNLSERKAMVYIIPTGVFPFIGMLAVYLLEGKIHSPMLTIEGVPLYILGILILIFLIGISIWSSSWILIFGMMVLALPVLAQRIFQLSDLVTAYILIGSLFIYGLSTWLWSKKEKAK